MLAPVTAVNVSIVYVRGTVDVHCESASTIIVPYYLQRSLHSSAASSSSATSCTIDVRSNGFVCFPIVYCLLVATVLGPSHRLKVLPEACRLAKFDARMLLSGPRGVFYHRGPKGLSSQGR